MSAIPSNLVAVRTELKSAFVGRDAEIDGLLTALLAGTHLLLLGPPGTAKSLLTQTFSDVCGGSYFQRLLTAFSTPEEVFGPYDLSALEQGKYQRITQGYMPNAEVAFCDEIFKANSAILNSLLTLLNEREFDNGASRISCPLQICVGASNEYPEDASLEALYDRFQIRHWVDYVSTRMDRFRLLTCADPRKQVTARFAPGEIATIQSTVRTVQVPNAVLGKLLDIADALAREHGIVVSDRRLRSSVKLIQARAYLNGRSVAEPRDLMILADSLWHRHEQRPPILATIMDHVAPGLKKARAFADGAREIYDGIGDYKTCVDLEKRLSKIMAAQDEISKLDPQGTNADIQAVRNDVRALVKEVAAGFAKVTGLIRGLSM